MKCDQLIRQDLAGRVGAEAELEAGGAQCIEVEEQIVRARRALNGYRNRADAGDGGWIGNLAAAVVIDDLFHAGRRDVDPGRAAFCEGRAAGRVETIAIKRRTHVVPLLKVMST